MSTQGASGLRLQGFELLGLALGLRVRVLWYCGSLILVVSKSVRIVAHLD